MAVGGLGWPWATLKRGLRLMAISQAMSPLVSVLVVLLASSISGTTVDSPSSSPLPPPSFQPPIQLPVTQRQSDPQCCGADGSSERAACPRDTPPPTPTQLVQLCSDPTVACSSLPLPCLSCSCDYGCTYGQQSNATCSVWGHAGVEGDKSETISSTTASSIRRGESLVQCSGEREGIQREFTCSYCYLTDPRGHRCSTRDLGCRSVGSPTSHHHWYVANCTSGPSTLCLGKQVFSKRVECNWTEGYSWRTAMVLSITLGGFGADRFYLGHWQEGIGKLFSFGGLGVWTLVDVVLVAIGYIGPADGSLYI